MTLNEIRQKYPQYKDVPDAQLVDAFYKKYYSDIPLSKFQSMIGYSQPVDQIASIPDDWAVSEMPAWKRAAAGGGKNLSDIYAGIMDIVTDRDHQVAQMQERDAPLMSDPYAMAGNIGMGVASMLPTMAIPGANTFTGAALTGGIYGALQPTSEDQSRVGNTLTGVAGGAGGYGIGKGIGMGLQQIAKPIKAGINLFRNPRQRAMSKVTEAMGRDDMIPQQLSSNMRKMGPQSTLADAGGENMLGLAEATAQVPGRTRNQTVAMLNRRQLNQSGRTMDALSDAIGDEKNFYSVLDEINSSLKTKSSPFYQQAFSENLDMSSKTIDRILETPAGRKAFQGARVRMQNRMAMLAKPDPELSEQARFLASIDKMDTMPDGVSKGLKLRTLDFIKQEMDDTIGSLEKQVRNGTARPGEVADLRLMKNKLVSELDSLDTTGGKYAQARQVFGSDAKNRQALESGRNFLKEDAEMTEHLLGKMSDAERENFRAGAMRAIRDKIESASDTSDVYKRIFNTESTRKKLRTLFPDSRSYASFARKMKTEAQFFRTRGTITGNSATAKRLAMEQDIGIDPNATSGAVLSWKYALARALMRKLQGQGGIPEPVRNELGGILMNQSPTANKEIITGLLRGPVNQPLMPGIDQSVGGLLSKPGAVMPFSE